MELALASHGSAEYSEVNVQPALFADVTSAIQHSKITGAQARSSAGAFPLTRKINSGGDAALWDQWCKHIENAAVRSGYSKSRIAGLLGALGELQDNIIEHSGKPSTGLVAYGITAEVFEFVVADSGIGVLASLRQNPEFAGLPDSGRALLAAISDGASRYDRSTGHGFGISRLFRSLANEYGELRFRSGDYALKIWGDTPSVAGQFQLSQKAWLAGLTISVRYTRNHAAT